MNHLLALSASDYTALAGALVLVIGAISAGAVAIIKAIKGTDETHAAQHEETIKAIKEVKR